MSWFFACVMGRGSDGLNGSPLIYNVVKKKTRASPFNPSNQCAIKTPYPTNQTKN